MKDLLRVPRSQSVGEYGKDLSAACASRPGLNNPKSLIVIYFGQAFEAVFESLKQWKREGIAPSNLGGVFLDPRERLFDRRSEVALPALLRKCARPR